jgi:ankyrin repeat protein
MMVFRAKSIFFLLLVAAKSSQAGANGGVERLADASRRGDLKMAETLVSSGVNPDLPDEHGAPALWNAALFNQTRIVELLLAHHADPDAQVNRRQPSQFPATALQCAASFGNLRMASLLITAGAHINSKASSGRTALHFAVVGSHLDVIQLLIEKGADVNARDAEGTSALDDAVWRGSLNTVAILLAHGARLNETETKTGATPINEAAYRGKTPLVRYLLQFNPDLGITDKRGYGPLENAIRMGQEECAVLLLETEAKGPQASQFLASTMEAAIQKNEPALVNALLQHGVSANGDLPSGANPLEDASLKGLDAIVKMLLDHGALVNRVNTGSGTTALYAAASFGKSDVVRLLLKQGANPNLCGRNHKSPYQAAVENGYQDVAAQIQLYGGAKSCGISGG